MFKKTLIAGAILASMVGSNAFAADLTLKGSIVPAACSINFDAITLGVVDYSEKTVEEVEALTEFANGKAYTAPAKTVGLTIACGSPTLFGFSLRDSRDTTAMDLDADDDYGYGLSMDKTQKSKAVGQYRVSFANLKVKGLASETTGSAPGKIYLMSYNPLGITGGTWNVATAATNDAKYFQHGKFIGFQAGATGTSPNAVAEIKGDLDIQAYFNKDLVKTTKDKITIDGLAVLELAYK